MKDFSKVKLILGSASPRRQELIKALGMPVEVIVKPVNEVYPDDMDFRKVPTYLAALKASPFQNTLLEHEILITSDTMVLLENEILGKPKNLEEAIEMLKKINGKKHEVITGVCLKSDSKEVVFSETTEVFFSLMEDDFIERYVDQYKPLDKAGAYAIQEPIGIVGIKRINGCFYNVMGLPVSRLWKELMAF